VNPPGVQDVKRGDIFMVDWGKDAGLHPALIIQNDTGNRYSNSIIVAYITHTPSRGLPMLVDFADHETSLEHGGSINLGRIMTIPKSVLKEKKGRVSAAVMEQVGKAIKISLGLE